MLPDNFVIADLHIGSGDGKEEGQFSFLNRNFK